MTLNDEVKKILNNFDNVSSDKVIEILKQIQPCLKSDLTQNYLNGKIHSVLGMSNESEKKKLCKNLKPYLDWYIQGV